MRDISRHGPPIAGKACVSPIPQSACWARNRGRNFSVKPTLARFSMHLPPEHKGCIASSCRAERLDLPPPVAGFFDQGGHAGTSGVGGLAIPSTGTKGEEDVILWEAAVVSLMTLLYSPLTWRQHCVAVVPAFYLICRTHRAKGWPSQVDAWALGVYVFFVLLLDRGVVGRDMTLILDSFGATTCRFLLLLAVTLGCHGPHCARRMGSASLPKGLGLRIR